MIVSDGGALDDVVDGLVDYRKWNDVPFLRPGDTGVDLELYCVKETVDEVFKLGGLDVGHLVGLDYLDVGKKVSGLVLGVLYALLNGLAGEANLVEVFDTGDVGVCGEGLENVNPAGNDIVFARSEVLGQIVWIAVTVIHHGVALGVEGFGESLLIDVVLGAVLENTAGAVIGTATGITAFRILVNVCQGLMNLSLSLLLLIINS